MGIFRSLSILAVLFVAAPAAADGTDIKKADALFAEGIALRDSNLEQSCNKFAESLKYNPQAIGTILNVALCDEKLGRIASAVRRFSDARDRAKEQQLEDHLKAAEEHLAVLVPELPHLTLKFVEPPGPDTKVLIDDDVVSVANISDLPVDPGERVIVVSAPGRLPFQTTIVIAKREHKELEIPVLQKSVTVKSSRRTIGWITATAGVVAIGTGIGLGVYAKGQYDDQFVDPDPADPLVEAPCQKREGAKPQCDPIGQPKAESARTLGHVGTAIGIVGIAAVGVGAYLWLRAPDDTTSERRVSVVPHVTPHEAGFVAIGRF